MKTLLSCVVAFSMLLQNFAFLPELLDRTEVQSTSSQLQATTPIPSETPQAPVETPAVPTATDQPESTPTVAPTIAPTTDLGSGYPAPADPSLTATPEPTATQTPIEATPTEDPADNGIFLDLTATPDFLPSSLKISITWSLVGVNLDPLPADAWIYLWVPDSFSPEGNFTGELDPELNAYRFPLNDTWGKTHWSVAPEGEEPFEVMAQYIEAGEVIETTYLQISDNRVSRIDPAGGEAEGLFGKVKIKFPQNSVKKSLDITIHRPSRNDAPPTQLMGGAVRILAQDVDSMEQVTHFDQPVEISIHYDPEMIVGNEEELMLHYYDTEAATWVPLYSWVNTEDHTLHAYSDHFTDFDYSTLGWEAAKPNSLDAAKSGGFTGAATYDYPIEVPAGPAGLQPQISLSYNSQVVDGASTTTQAAWVGMGWDLNFGGFIKRDQHHTRNTAADDTFLLTLNGMSTRLIPIDGTPGINISAVIRYRPENDNFLKVSRTYLNSKINNVFTEQSTWTVWDKVGHIYTFTTVGTYAGCEGGSGTQTAVVYRPWYWGMTSVKNIYGKILSFSYYSEYTAGKTCYGDPGYAVDLFTAVYPSEIVYPNNRYRIKFIRDTTTRHDYDKIWQTNQNVYVQYERSLLSSIQVVHDPDGVNNNGDEEIIREYALTYNTDTIFNGITWPNWPAGTTGDITGVPALTQITEYGLGGIATGYALPVTKFSYKDSNSTNTIHLTQVDNGYGGSVEFRYEADPWPANDPNAAIEPAKYYTKYYKAGASGPGYTQMWNIYPYTQVTPGGTFRFGINARTLSQSSTGQIMVFVRNDETGDFGTKTLSIDYSQDVSSVLIKFPEDLIFTPSTGKIQFWFVCQVGCYVDYMRYAPVLTRYRVTERIVRDSMTGSEYSYTYDYGAPATNGTKEASWSYMYQDQYSEFNGHEFAKETDPYGKTTTVYFHQDRVLKGSPATTITSNESFFDDFSTLDTNRWGTANSVLVSPGSESGSQIKLTGSAASPASFYRINSPDLPAYSLSDGETALVQFKVSSTSDQAIIGINTEAPYYRWGIKYVNGNIEAQYCEGNDSTCSSPAVIFPNITLNQWYFLQITLDDEEGFLIRVWERNKPGNSRMYRDQGELSGKTGLSWRFMAKTFAGSFLIDNYSESVLASISDNSYQISGLPSYMPAAPNPLVLPDGKAYGDLGINWVKPEFSRQFIFDGSLFTGTQATNYFDPAYQNGTYGNLTQTVESIWDGTTFVDQRVTYRKYYPLSNGISFIPELPAKITTFRCQDTINGQCYNFANPQLNDTSEILSSQEFIYDANTSYQAAPTNGKLTWVRTQLSSTGDSYQDVKYEYDGWGNPIRVSNYPTAGTSTSRGTGTPTVTSTCFGDTNNTNLPVCVADNYHTYPTARTNSALHTLQWEYDKRFGLPLYEIGLNGEKTTFEYDNFGRLNLVILPGDSSYSPSLIYSYQNPNTDSQHLMPAVFSTQRRTNFAGEGTPRYLQTSTVIDGLGRKVQIQTAANQVSAINSVTVDYLYDAYGQVLKQTVPYEADNSQLFGSWSFAAGAVSRPFSQTSYDWLGRPAAQFATDGAETTFEYGLSQFEIVYSIGIIDEVEYFDRQEDLYSFTRVNQFALNGAGSDRSTITYADAFGRTVAVDAPLDPDIYYHYDPADHLTDVYVGYIGSADDLHFTHTVLSYDLAGRKTSMKDPDMGLWTYRYDALGNLTAQTDAKMQTTCLYYDSIQRLTIKNYQSSPACLDIPAAPYAVQYSYDATGPNNSGVGQRTGMIDASGSTAWEYDLRGRVTHEIKTVRNSLGANEELGSYHTYWSYNPDDSVRQMVYPNQETVNFRYNPLAQIDQVYATITDANGAETLSSYVVSTTYDEAGRVRSRTLGNQMLQGFDYYEWTDVNGQGRLERIQATIANESLLDLYYWQPNVAGTLEDESGPGYDTFGNITSVLEFRQNPDTDVIYQYQTQSYTYDELDRLTSAEVSGGDGPYTEDTSYDSYGRLAAKGTHNYTYSEGHPHAVTSVTGGGDYQYDANGNMTSRVVDGVTYTLAYDSENRLISIQGGTVDAHYLYDGDGRRVLTVVGGARTVYIADYFEAELGDGSSPTSLPALQNYPASLGPTYPARVFLPGVMKPQVAAQTTSGNHGTTLYRTHPVDPPEGVTWRSYYSAGGARVAEREIVHPAGGPVSQQVFYLIADHLGSTTVVTNQNGVEAGRNMYTAWGESRGTTGTLPTSRLYTGQLEAEAGLYYYGARFYDPYIGRFMSADTILPEPGNPIAWDRYAYSNNNPINYSDPSGHWPEKISDGGLFYVLIGLFTVVVGGTAVYDDRVRRHETGDSSSNTSLAQCFTNNEIKEFQDHEQINQQEFNEMLVVISDDIDEGIRTPIDYARVTYDTPFFDGNSIFGEKNHKDQVVCFGNDCYHQSSVNYVAQGMYAAASGQSLEESNQMVQNWNKILYGHDASSEELLWNQYGYEYYQKRRAEQQ